MTNLICPVCKNDISLKAHDNGNFICENNHYIIFIKNPDNIVQFCTFCTQTELIKLGLELNLYICRICGKHYLVEYDKRMLPKKAQKLLEKTIAKLENRNALISLEFDVLFWEVDLTNELIIKKFKDLKKQHNEVFRKISYETMILKDKRDFANILLYNAIITDEKNFRQIPKSIIKDKRGKIIILNLNEENHNENTPNIEEKDGFIINYVREDIINCNLLKELDKLIVDSYFSYCLEKEILVI